MAKQERAKAGVFLGETGSVCFVLFDTIFVLRPKVVTSPSSSAPSYSSSTWPSYRQTPGNRRFSIKLRFKPENLEGNIADHGPTENFQSIVFRENGWKERNWLRNARSGLSRRGESLAARVKDSAVRSDWQRLLCIPSAFEAPLALERAKFSNAPGSASLRSAYSRRGLCTLGEFVWDRLFASFYSRESKFLLSIFRCNCLHQPITSVC